MDLESILSTVKELNGHILVGAGGIVGILGLTVQYFRGKWPWYKNPENQWVMRQWFSGGRTSPINPEGTHLHLWPIKLIRYSGEHPDIITRKTTEGNMELDFVDDDGLMLFAKAQYAVQIPNTEGAIKSYWDVRNSLGLADSIIEQYLKTKVNGISGENRKGTIREALFGSQAEAEAKLSKLKEENPLYKLTGLVLRKLSITDVKYYPETQKIMETVARKKKEAEGERSEREILFETIKGYRTKALELSMEEATKMGYDPTKIDYPGVVRKLFDEHIQSFDRYQAAQEGVPYFPPGLGVNPAISINPQRERAISGSGKKEE